MARADQWFWYVLIAVVGLVALCELIWPRRQVPAQQAYRIVGNWGLYALSTALTLLFTASLPAAFALFSQQQHWGLLNQIQLPFFASFTLSVLMISLMNYGLHRLMHGIAFFWAIHKVHHSDIAVDFSTSVRHHPAETLVSLLFNGLAIWLLGLDPVAAASVPAVQLMLAFYQHANMRTHPLFESILKPFIVTADMHQIHHSLDLKEGNSNFGTIFPWWDQLFGTYVANPFLKPDEMKFGIEQARSPDQLGLDKLLTLPLR